MKILVVGRKFGGVAGGVERMAIPLLNALCERGHEARLLTWDLDGAEAYYPVNPGIRWHRLNMGDAAVKAGWKLRLARQLRMRALIERERPDVIVAFQQGPFVAIRLAALGLGISPGAIGGGGQPPANGSRGNGKVRFDPRAAPNAGVGAPPPEPIRQQGSVVPAGERRPGANQTEDQKLNAIGLVGPGG